MLAAAVWSFQLVRSGRKVPGWLVAVFAVLFIVGFLTWVVGSARTPNVALYGLLAGSVTLAVPLIFGSLSGVLCERSGVINVAIEGQMLAGAFSAAVAGSARRQRLRRPGRGGRRRRPGVGCCWPCSRSSTWSTR